MTRFGKRVAALTDLRIDYPVGRSATRFQALLATSAIAKYDAARLHFFVVQDDAGNRYPAMIDQVAALPEDSELTLSLIHI